MKYSVRPGEPGCENFRGFGRTLVLLDGAEVKGVLSADDEAGIVETAALDANGRCIIEGTALRWMFRRGRVEIREGV